MENALNNTIQKSDEIMSKLEKEPGCKTCKNNKLSTTQIWMVVLSIFILSRSSLITFKTSKN